MSSTPGEEGIDNPLRKPDGDEDDLTGTPRHTQGQLPGEDTTTSDDPAPGDTGYQGR